MSDLRDLSECPFRIGQKVIVNGNRPFSDLWPGVYVVTSLRYIAQPQPGVSVGLVTERDFLAGTTPMGGFKSTDLLVASQELGQ